MSDTPPSGPGKLTVEDYISGVLARDRTILARSITLVESSVPAHAALAQEVLEGVLPRTGGAVRVGVTGSPGVGKSCLIEALGRRLTAAGTRVAVLTVDPSSTITRGSILGDKTRMTRLSNDPLAFIRPTPSAGSLGGVARKTREALLLCEAAGYEVVLIETVGVGQSEVTVRSMVDFFLVLILAGAGDELQGIKKGVIELADALAITKADGDNAELAAAARQEYAGALHLLAPITEGWTVAAHTCSAVSGAGVGEIWETIEAHRRHGERTGIRQRNRRSQALRWMHELVGDRLRRRFFDDPRVAAALPELERAVEAGELPPGAAAARLLDITG